MRTSFITALLLIGAVAHSADQLRAKRNVQTDEEHLLADDIGEGSGETSGNASAEASGDASGVASEETIENASGEGSGDSSPVVPVTELTLKQLEILNTYARQVQAESQKLIHQANFVITEMTSLSSSAQNLGILSNVILTNSQSVLDNANLTLIETENVTAVSPTTCVASSVCYGDSGCGNGKCIGALAGTCNCNSCVYGWPCQEDSACGGFAGACNSLTATCDCFTAYTKHNLTLTTALTSFCNVAKCNGAVDNVEKCFGLPCNYGFCVC